MESKGKVEWAFFGTTNLHLFYKYAMITDTDDIQHFSYKYISVQRSQMREEFYLSFWGIHKFQIEILKKKNDSESIEKRWNHGTYK